MKKVLLVTGGGRGIGKSTAIMAGKLNYNVGINYLKDKEAADETASIIKKNGGNCISIKGDIANFNDVNNVFDELTKTFGPVNYLVANAGDIPKRKSFFETDISDLERTIQVNLTGTIYCVHKFTKLLINQSINGSMVLISSEAARFGGNRISMYAATKAALNTFVVGAAREVGPFGIRINAVSPGTIYTKSLENEGEQKLKQIRESIPLGRIGTVNEAAETIHWLLSDKSSYVSGSMITVSGGR